jgi:hypothetical protein
MDGEGRWGGGEGWFDYLHAEATAFADGGEGDGEGRKVGGEQHVGRLCEGYFELGVRL